MGARPVRAHAEAVVGRVGHEQDQERAHAVVAEALPELGEEEGRQPPRVSEPLLVSGGRCAHRVLLTCLVGMKIARRIGQSHPTFKLAGQSQGWMGRLSGEPQSELGRV